MAVVALISFWCQVGHVCAQQVPPPEPVVVWEPSTTPGITKYRLHRSEIIGFDPKEASAANPDTTFVREFVPNNTPNESFRYTHPKELTGERYYYKVLIPDNGKESVSNEAAVIRSGTDTYVFDISHNIPPRFRAVAGAVLNNEEHIVPLNLHITVTRNGQAIPGVQPFVFSLADNVGTGMAEPKQARLVDVDDDPATTGENQNEKRPDSPELWQNLPAVVDESRDLKTVVERSSNANGDIVVRVLSGQTITSMTKLVIQWKEVTNNTSTLHSVTQLPLEFVRAESRRGFTLPTFAETGEVDTGWEPAPLPAENNLTREVLVFPGEMIAFKVHLKCRLDINQNAVLRPVVGHKLQISMADVLRKALDRTKPTETKNGITINNFNEILAPIEEFNDFVFFTDSEGYLIGQDGSRVLEDNLPIRDPQQAAAYPLPAFITVPTGPDGTATVYLKAGPLIDKCVYFGLKAVDVTQRKPQ